MTAGQVASEEFGAAAISLVEFVGGANFSGRSSEIRAVLTAEGRPFVHIRADVASCLSGLASDVRSELEWFTSNAELLRDETSIVDALSVRGLLDRDPMTLSGGEQVCVALCSAAMQRPRAIGLDCCLEQLDRSRLHVVLEALRELARSGTRVVLSDNRLHEPDRAPINMTARELCAASDRPMIDSTQEFHQPCYAAPDLQLQRISHWYWLGPRWFEGIARYLLAPSPGASHERELPAVRALAFSQFWARRLKGPPVLTGASYRFEPGIVYRLDGANGSGKSTLAKLLVGAMRLWDGELVANGVPVKPWMQPGKLVSYHFQNPDLQLAATTVRAELELGLSPLSFAQRRPVGSSRTYTAEYISEVFGLRRFLDEHPYDLPFVLRKRVMLAVSLASTTPWVILDEPTLGQDRSTCEAIAEIIARQVAAGRGILLITHSDWFASLLRARTVLLRRGEVADV